MQIETAGVRESKKLLWTGRIITALAILFLLMDTAIHFLKPPPVVDAFARLGLPLGLATGIAIIELICLLLYVFPRTSILGAILLTGYLGGAVAINMRAGSPLFETIFPVIFGLIIWAGLFLRDEKLLTLLSLRQ